MRDAKEILESLGESRLKIVETGCFNSRSIARWVSENPESDFINVDLDFTLQLATHKELETDGTARFCRFLTQDHTKYLSNRTWVDVIFLNPPDLQNGLTEFLLAVSTGARIIVINDYQAKAALAIRRAKDLGWQYENAGPLNILRRVK